MKRDHPSLFENFALYLAWVTAVIATLGSLYFSEIKGYVPCELCWYQRILMYPFAIILGIAAFHNDKKIKRYVLPVTLLGGTISLYHYLTQKIPGFAMIRPCQHGVPCTVQYINWFGFVTIPFLALIAFTIISAIMIYLYKKEKASDR